MVCSGGLDSVVLAYHVKRDRELAQLLSFDYGQRHKKELDFAAQAAVDLGVQHDVIDISNLAPFLTGSALTDDVDVPDGHYAQATMQATIVPNRNAIMLAIAYGVAAGAGVSDVAIAVHGGDHFIYPDCRPDFIDAFRTMENHALDGSWQINLYAPYIEKTKTDIARLGAELDVPFEKSWSCYKGGAIHCGRCGTCVERAEAFHLAGIPDPTDYADPEYWREACR